MSFPRRPNVGLPSNPRARPSSAQAGQTIPPPRPRSAASERPPPSIFRTTPPSLPSQPRILRPQRSVGNLPERPASSVRSRSLRRVDSHQASSRSDPPPPLPSFPSLPRGPRLESSQSRGDAPARAASQSTDYDAYRKRDDRVSHSTSSSVTDDSRSPVSAASSRTSFYDEDMDDTKMEMDKKPTVSLGSALWGNIAGVAGNLTISVSKAWSSKVASFSGEETPLGGESRLTRVMKAYHIEKARDPSDLPEWLFNEFERGVRNRPTASRVDPGGASDKKQAQSASSLSRTDDTVTRDDADAPPPARVARGPTLADSKAATRADRDAYSGGPAHVTKSMMRLRELCNAKRNAKVRFDETEDLDINVEAGSPAMRTTAGVPPEPQRAYSARDDDSNSEGPPPTRPREMASALSPGASIGVRGRQPATRLGLPASVRPVRA